MNEEEKKRIEEKRKRQKALDALDSLKETIGCNPHFRKEGIKERLGAFILTTSNVKGCRSETLSHLQTVKEGLDLLPEPEKDQATDILEEIKPLFV